MREGGGYLCPISSIRDSANYFNHIIHIMRTINTWNNKDDSIYKRKASFVLYVIILI